MLVPSATATPGQADEREHGLRPAPPDPPATRSAARRRPTAARGRRPGRAATTRDRGPCPECSRSGGSSRRRTAADRLVRAREPVAQLELELLALRLDGDRDERRVEQVRALVDREHRLDVADLRCRGRRGRRRSRLLRPSPASEPSFVTALSIPAVSISPAIVVTSLPPICWCSATRTSLTYRASSWNAAAPIERSTFRARVGTGIDCQRAAVGSSRRGRRGQRPRKSSPPPGMPVVRIENARALLRRGAARTASTLPGRPNDERQIAPRTSPTRARCATSACCRSSCARGPSARAAAGEEQGGAQSHDDPREPDHASASAAARLSPLHPSTWYVQRVDEALTEQVRAAMPYAATLGIEMLAASTDEVQAAGRVGGAADDRRRACCTAAS